MSVSAANWVNKLDMMGIFADKGELQVMLQCAPSDPSVAGDVEALKARLAELG